MVFHLGLENGREDTYLQEEKEVKGVLALILRSTSAKCD